MQEAVHPAGGHVTEPGAQGQHPVEIHQGAGQVGGQQAVAPDPEQVLHLAPGQPEGQGGGVRREDQVGFGQGFVVIFRHRVHARRHGKDAAFRQGQIQIRAGQGQADHLAGVAGQARPGRGLGGQEGIQGGERGGEQ